LNLSLATSILQHGAKAEGEEFEMGRDSINRITDPREDSFPPVCFFFLPLDRSSIPQSPNVVPGHGGMFVLDMFHRGLMALGKTQDESRIVIKGCPSTGIKEVEKVQWKKVMENHKWSALPISV
jgi:hypothetical protein